MALVLHVPVGVYWYAVTALALATFLYRLWQYLQMERWNDEDGVSRPPIFNIPVKTLNIPFTITLSEDRRTLTVASLTTGWCLYECTSLPIDTVLTDVLSSHADHQVYFDLIQQSTSEQSVKHEYSSPGVHTIDLESFTVRGAIDRTTYPLVLIATNMQDTLVSLVHVSDSHLSTTYIIGQFYRNSLGTFHRLTSLYKSTDMDTDECVVCLSNAAVCAFLPCRHMAVCEHCVHRLTSCPVCRSLIGSYFNIRTNEEAHR